MAINKVFKGKKANDISPISALTWAVALHPESEIVLADNGRQTMIGVRRNGETNFYVECGEDEIEYVLSSMPHKRPIVNFKVAKGRKSMYLGDTRKVVVTRLHPGSVLRLYWRIPHPDAPGGYMDVMWCDVGRDGNMGPLEELSFVLERNNIAYSDVIREDL